MRKIQFRSGYYYHIYNRGVNRQAIFFNDENWGYFMRRLRHYCTSELIEIIAYCLMPNHCRDEKRTESDYVIKALDSLES